MNWEVAQVLHAEATAFASGASLAIDLGAAYRLLRQTLAVSAATGTLDVAMQSSADGLTGWRTFATFEQVGAAAVQRITAIAPDRWVRLAWTLGGVTPSFTFAVSGTKGIVFANVDDLNALGIPSGSMGGISASSKAEQLAATTELASGILAGRYDLPITAWGADLTQAVCKIAGYELLSVRGLAPDGDDSNVRRRYEDAMKWLADVAAGSISPVGLVDSTPTEPDLGGVEVVTTKTRGW